MELPFEYIVLSIYRIFDDRDMPLVINKGTLNKYIVNLANILSNGDYKLKSIFSSFDYEIELDLFIQKYNLYIYCNNNDIVFDYDYIDELYMLIDEAINEYDDKIIDIINEVIDNNFILLEVLGIKINKRMYHCLLDNESKLEELYINLRKADTDDKKREDIIKKIKIFQLKNSILLFNMNNHLNYNECYDLLLYGTDYAKKFDYGYFYPESLDVNYYNDLIFDSALWRSLFNIDSLALFISRDKIDKLTNYKDDCFSRYDKSELKFYLVYLNLLDREIQKATDSELREEFITAKYRLMNTLDSLYGTVTFMKKEDLVVSFMEDNYESFAMTIFDLIDDLLNYADDDYNALSETKMVGNTKNIVAYYYSTIEKLYIETYYSLTHDRNIESAIKENKLYGVNSISSGMLDEIVNNPKRKIK